MHTPLLAAAGSTLVAAVLTALLALRAARAPRLDLIAWAIAAIGLTLALAAQAVGFSGSFSATTFRAVQLGAQVVAPLGLVWGLAEAMGRGVGGRFAARLALGALTLLGLVIVATDPLGSTAFTSAWPGPDVFFNPIAHYMLLLLAVVTVVWALAAAAVAGVRSSNDRDWQQMLLPALAAAAATLVVQALRLALPGNSVYPVVCLAAVALAWFAARGAGALPLAEMREAPYGPDQGWDGRHSPRGGYGDDTGYDDLYRSDTGGFRSVNANGYRDVGADTGGYGFYREDTGSFAVDTGSFAVDTGSFEMDTGSFGADRGYGPHDADAFGRPGQDDTGAFDGLYRDEPRGPGEDLGARREQGPRHGDPLGQNGAAEPDGGPDAPGVVETGDFIPAINDLLPPGAASGAGVDTAQLYGQIAIYTLLEGHAEEFDRLAKDVVDQVREREPNTLVFVLHGVPSAPMQRILYEVYRDSAAYEEHLRRPYIQHFDEQRSPFVLATNVIELGVRQAKVSPLQEQPPPADRRDGDFWTRGQQ